MKMHSLVQIWPKSLLFVVRDVQQRSPSGQCILSPRIWITNSLELDNSKEFFIILFLRLPWVQKWRHILAPKNYSPIVRTLAPLCWISMIKKLKWGDIHSKSMSRILFDLVYFLETKISPISSCPKGLRMPNF